MNSITDEQNNRLTGNKSKYIKAMIDWSKFYSGIGSTLRNASRKKLQKARILVYFLKNIFIIKKLNTQFNNIIKKTKRLILGVNRDENTMRRFYNIRQTISAKKKQKVLVFGWQN